MKRIPQLLRCAALAFGMAVGATAGASPIAALVVFGDSLSDPGNAFALTSPATPFPPAPYYVGGHFSNGPTATEQFAQQTGLPTVNLAQGGATTGTLNINNGRDVLGLYNVPNVLSGMQQQFTGYVGSHLIDAGTLYVVWGGPNNFFADASMPSLVAAITDLATYVGTLRTLGAQHIMVPNMPDLSLTPYGLSLPALQRAGLAALVQGFNDAMALNIWAPNAGVVIPVDVFGILNAVLANPAGFGFTDTISACNADPACLFNPTAQDQHVFWDDVHPTMHTAAILARGFVLATGLPEPGSLWLAAPLALALLMMVRRPRAVRHALS